MSAKHAHKLKCCLSPSLIYTCTHTDRHTQTHNTYIYTLLGPSHALGCSNFTVGGALPPHKRSQFWQWCVSMTAGLKYSPSTPHPHLSLSFSPLHLSPPTAVAGYSSLFSFDETSVSFFVCLIQASWERLGYRGRGLGLGSYSGEHWEFPLGQFKCDHTSKHTN